MGCADSNRVAVPLDAVRLERRWREEAKDREVRRVMHKKKMSYPVLAEGLTLVLNLRPAVVRREE